jgi:regulator of replication initiation timing
MDKDLTFEQFRETVKQIENYAREQGISKPITRPVDERKMVDLQWNERLKAHYIVVKVSKEPTYEGIDFSTENAYIKVIIGKATEKGNAIVYWCQIDEQEYKCNNKEEKQEKTIAELMQDYIGDEILYQAMTDCIIENKEDIEQLKKDVKALRKENTKLRQIVNELRKG